MKKKAILIVGMHRSGTSAVAGSLSFLGLDFGRNLIPPAFDNEKGFFENMDFLNVHEAVLSELASSWDSIGPLPSEWWQSGNMEPYKQQIREIILKTFGGSEVFGVKDPRLSRLFPLWQAVLEELHMDYRLIMPVRNPLEVALSLVKRNNFSLEKGALLWMLYNIEAEQYTRPYPRIIIPYDAFLEQPEQFLQSVTEQFHIGDPLTVRTALPAVNGFLEPALRHHRVDRAVRDEGLPDFVTSLYRLLTEISDGGGMTSNSGAIDRTKAEFTQMLNFFYPQDIRKVLENTLFIERELEMTQQKLSALQSLWLPPHGALNYLKWIMRPMAAYAVRKIKAPLRLAKEHFSEIKNNSGQDAR